jgi:hypothetical protein
MDGLPIKRTLIMEMEQSATILLEEGEPDLEANQSKACNFTFGYISPVWNVYKQVAGSEIQRRVPPSQGFILCAGNPHMSFLTGLLWGIFDTVSKVKPKLRFFTWEKKICPWKIARF